MKMEDYLSTIVVEAGEDETLSVEVYPDGSLSAWYRDDSHLYRHYWRENFPQSALDADRVRIRV